MAQEKGAEMPLEKFARFKKDISLWYEEMRQWGLTEDEMHILEPIAKGSYGITESQEAFMQLVQMPECGGFDLMWADRLRKSIAKKNPKEFDQLTKEYFENCEEKGLSKNLCNYVWKVLVAYSRGYGFNKSHTLAYSLIALQEMNLAYKYPIMFWNCACLISDAGGNEENEIDEEAEEEFKAEEVYSNEMEEFNEEEDEAEDSYEEDEDCDGYPAEVIKTKDGKKKKKTKVTNYGKIATAIGKITSEGVSISPPDINHSTYTFSPDIESNSIRYGLSGITRIGEDLVKTIILNRPYNGIEDFLSKVKVNKPQMINLIKSGAFDAFGNRIDIMHQYVNMISDTKKRITLQNMKMLIDFGLIPDEYDFQRRVYNFNKYLKKFKKGIYYGLDDIAFGFYSNNFDIDFCSPCDDSGSGFQIKQVVWDKIYQKQMDIIRPFVQKNNKELLDAVNNRLTHDVWYKYCLGTISKWEMDSISCYIHPHELMGIDYEKYGLDRFADLAPEPTIDRFIPIKGKMIPIYKLSRIVGTVLDRDKAKKTVSLLTEDGVVTVKIYGVFQAYDRQLSEQGADGKKHVLRKSEFTRGNKLIITGIRDGENEFRAKVYKNTPFHHIETISEICGSDIVIDNRNDLEE
jgi:DNA polymerase-3 subunit alpha